MIKVRVDQNETCTETEVVIHCKEIDENVMRLLASLRAADRKLVGEKDGKSFVIDPKEIFYFESVDKKTFFYTQKEVYESPLRLYEIEEKFAGVEFFRAAKSLIINLKHVRTFIPSLGGKIEVTLDNKERLFVSRQYVHSLKEKLGM